MYKKWNIEFGQQSSGEDRDFYHYGTSYFERGLKRKKRSDVENQYNEWLRLEENKFLSELFGLSKETKNADKRRKQHVFNDNMITKAQLYGVFDLSDDDI